MRFLVDNVYKCSDNMPTASDADGNLVNCISATHDNIGDGLDELETEPQHIDSDKSTYGQIIPVYLENRADKLESPPNLPAQLNKVLLNSRSIQSQDAHILPIPKSSSLNHLYASSIRDGVMAVGTTMRYRQKYVTTVYYKPVLL